MYKSWLGMKKNKKKLNFSAMLHLHNFLNICKANKKTFFMPYFTKPNYETRATLASLALLGHKLTGSTIP
jgi:hypothetical protein